MKRSRVKIPASQNDEDEGLSVLMYVSLFSALVLSLSLTAVVCKRKEKKEGRCIFTDFYI